MRTASVLASCAWLAFGCGAILAACAKPQPVNPTQVPGPHERRFEVPHDPGSAGLWTSYTDERAPLVGCAYRDGDAPVEGPALDDLKDLVERDLSRPHPYAPGASCISAIGVAPCGPLGSAERPSGLRCIRVYENGCTAVVEEELRSLAATVEGELVKNPMPMGATGVCVFLSGIFARDVTRR
jgi:hypothetical protein